jgi:hypothetical protein
VRAPAEAPGPYPAERREIPPWEEPPRRDDRRPDDYWRDDYREDDRWPRAVPGRRPAEAGEYRCPFCGCSSPPNVIQRTSPTGWVVFWTLLVLGLFCFLIGCLLCFIGLMIKESVRVCPVCGNTITGYTPY